MTFQTMTAQEYRRAIGAEEKPERRERLSVTLPYPPSANELKRGRTAKEKASGRKMPGMGKTKRYLTWERAAKNALRGQKTHKMPGAFSITIMHGVRHRHHRADLDNRIKAVLDILQTEGLIDDDNECEGIISGWDNELDDTQVYVIPAESTKQKAA